MREKNNEKYFIKIKLFVQKCKFINDNYTFQ